MFSVLFTESYGETPPRPDNENASVVGNRAVRKDPNISVVKHNELVYSQIRRFISVDNKHGFCYACPIFTYGGQGTLKRGCRPEDHSIVYYAGLQMPTPLPGEIRITKPPIGVIPTANDTSLTQMDVASRLNFGKAYLIEYNVKVKDHGKVRAEDMDTLIYHYKKELNG
ncbi:uncharacterized protein BDZ99DRAFT_399987 [Mytilinidion resinicola]|uniref:DUF6590 domain-containing protein n=1 Tax=Mytilinidion resinicola TaxID=574789 RepID=A0A6A6Y3X4_9PEZI|nr:uncharacterized protein BDZ99DRAFT_399987 [Mytilinidion resinicola]KAF2803223.1 hypothetical protein BDZ99DRAFT_399987 [Mytilinidion resinicola]